MFYRRIKYPCTRALIHTYPNSCLYFSLRYNTGTDVLFLKSYSSTLSSCLDSLQMYRWPCLRYLDHKRFMETSTYIIIAFNTYWFKQMVLFTKIHQHKNRYWLEMSKTILTCTLFKSFLLVNILYTRQVLEKRAPNVIVNPRLNTKDLNCKR